LRRWALIPSLEAVKAIDNRREDAVVVSATAALREWGIVSRRRDLDIHLYDCMDKAPSVGLGIALAQPERKVVVLDSDNVRRTDLASMITVGSMAPENVVHFLFEEDSRASGDGQPVPGMDSINFIGIARDGGYSRTYQFDNLEDLVLNLEEVMEGPGPTFVSLKVVYDREVPGYPERAIGDSVKSVRDTLAQEAG
jgi:phosphonopyruvate decarboxylase